MCIIITRENALCGFSQKKGKERKIPEAIWFQKYRIISLLGEGGSAQVFLARHERLGCYRAIKRVPKESQYHQQLMNETAILRNLKHPNIPIIYDVEEDERYSYIILEYIEGQSLRAYRLSQEQLRESVIIEFAIQISNLIHYLHVTENPILYLDLKPDNILVEGKTLKLIDFGAAVYGTEVGKRKLSLGTRGFASPEQYGQFSIDERSDIYSVGMLLYFLASGKSYLESNEKDLDSFCFLSSRFRKVIGKCLRYNPSQRYQTILQLNQKLNQIKKNTAKKQKQEAISFIITIAGSQNRIGTTHTAMMLAVLLNKMGMPAIYRQDMPEAPEEKGCRIYDLGALSQCNFSDFVRGDIKLLTAGIKEQEWNDTYRCRKELSGYKDVCYLLNFTDGRSYTQAVKNMGDSHCIRIPYCPSPQEAAKNKAAKGFALEVIKEGDKGIRRKKKAIRDVLSGILRADREASGKTVIGLAGTHSGVGVTHTGIALAAFLSNTCGKKTALIEMNGKSDFSYLQQAAGGNCEQSSAAEEFIIKNICFFPNADEKKAIEILNRRFDYVIFDFGTCPQRYRHEFLRCDIKLVLCSLCEWKKEYLSIFLQSYEKAGDGGKWKYLSVFGQRGEDTPVAVINVGFIPNPFVPAKEHEKVLLSLL